MSLKKLINLLGKLEYRPHALKLFVEGENELFLSLSPRSQLFMWALKGDYTPGDATWNDMYGKRWFDYPELLKAYWELEPEERAEVLGFCNFLMHELTHHVDFMTTPFGANFHIKACLEFVVMQEFAPRLLEHSHLIPGGRLVDFGDVLSSADTNISPELIKSWIDLVGKISLFDAFKGAHKKKIIQGWGSQKTVSLLWRELPVVTVHGFMLTLAVPESPRWYLRPLTILESRALIHSLRWILYNLGHTSNLNVTEDDLRIKEELILFLDSFYSTERVSPDYSFLLTLFAHIWKESTFTSLIRRMPLPNLDSVLRLIDGLCWYSLQAPPPSDDASLWNASPIVRLVIAIKRFEDVLEELSEKGGKLPFTSVAQFLIELDQHPISEKNGLHPIKRNLEHALEKIRWAQEVNRLENRHNTMKKHFEYIFEVQIRQMEKRLPDGYNSHLGMPENGNPMGGVSDEKDAEHLLMEYTPNEEVISWFTFRENLLFRFLPPKAVEEGLREWFSKYEGLIICDCGNIFTFVLPNGAEPNVQVPCPNCSTRHQVNPSDALKI